MESKEYRYQKYKEGVINELSPSNQKPIFGNLFMRLNEFSLFTLRDGLKSNSYYFNAVKYYNIMADVMLLVSIKEGNKILKGIKLVVGRNYSIRGTSNLSVDNIRGLRSKLSQFKSVFSDLILLITDKKLVIVSVNPEIKSFNNRVNSVMKLLSIQNDVIINIICKRILNKLKELKGDDAHFGGNWNKFEEFYFTESILHIKELYSFSAKNF